MGSVEKDYDGLLKNFSVNLKKIREKKKIRQAEMITFGFSERYIQKLESGKYSPSLYTCHKLAKSLDVDFTDLFKK